jgi:hypothetical protein
VTKQGHFVLKHGAGWQQAHLFRLKTSTIVSVGCGTTLDQRTRILANSTRSFLSSSPTALRLSTPWFSARLVVSIAEIRCIKSALSYVRFFFCNMPSLVMASFRLSFIFVCDDRAVTVHGRRELELCLQGCTTRQT